MFNAKVNSFYWTWLWKELSKIMNIMIASWLWLSNNKRQIVLVTTRTVILVSLGWRGAKLQFFQKKRASKIRILRGWERSFPLIDDQKRGKLDFRTPCHEYLCKIWQKMTYFGKIIQKNQIFYIFFLQKWHLWSRHVSLWYKKRFKRPI